MKPITLTPRHVVELRTRQFLEEHRRRIEHGTQQNRKAVTMRGDPLVKDEANYRHAVKSPGVNNSGTQLLMTKLNTYEGQAVSPAAPLNTPVPGYAMAVALGFTICAGAFSLAFAIYWILRIYL